nr:tyrosine-type recombinase/integrase [Actinoplanes solisilvae]
MTSHHPRRAIARGYAAASLAHAAGADLKTIQDLLGHSNVSLTADVYTEVLPDKATPSRRRHRSATA